MRFRNYHGLGSYLMDRDLAKHATTLFELIKPSSNIFSGISRGTGIRRNAAYFRRVPATLEVLPHRRLGPHRRRRRALPAARGRAQAREVHLPHHLLHRRVLAPPRPVLRARARPLRRVRQGARPPGADAAPHRSARVVAAHDGRRSRPHRGQGALRPRGLHRAARLQDALLPEAGQALARRRRRRHGRRQRRRPHLPEGPGQVGRAPRRRRAPREAPDAGRRPPRPTTPSTTSSIAPATRCTCARAAAPPRQARQRPRRSITTAGGDPFGYGPLPGDDDARRAPRAHRRQRLPGRAAAGGAAIRLAARRRLRRLGHAGLRSARGRKREARVSLVPRLVAPRAHARAVRAQPADRRSPRRARSTRSRRSSSCSARRRPPASTGARCCRTADRPRCARSGGRCFLAGSLRCPCSTARSRPFRPRRSPLGLGAEPTDDSTISSPPAPLILTTPVGSALSLIHTSSVMPPASFCI